MKLKEKRDETWKTETQPQAAAASESRTPSHEEIRCRAYEIYLERNGRLGDELGDWLRAESELQKMVPFTQQRNRDREEVAAVPDVESDARSNVATRGRS
jgi:hypothetical protein